MNLMDARALCRDLGRDQRLIGLDLGRRMIGVALSDVRRTLASPYGTVRRGKLSAVAVELRGIAAKEGAAGLIIGLPLSMDGSFGPAAQATRDWARAIAEATGLPAALWDERLSSAAVNRLLIGDADLSRGKRAGVVDRSAAAWILQSALDAVGRDIVLPAAAPVGGAERPDA
jgi:putative Holliday junction resolvase